MATYYVFERPSGKVQYEVNSTSSGYSIRGQLFTFSSLDKRSQFIKKCPCDMSRQEVRYCELRGLHLGMSEKEFKQKMSRLTLNAGLLVEK